MTITGCSDCTSSDPTDVENNSTADANKEDNDNRRKRTRKR